MSYLILCKQRVDGLALWWRCDRKGYTTDLQQAGRYSKEEAESIARIRGLDFPVDEADIGVQLKVRQVVSVEDGNSAVLRAYETRTSGETNDCPHVGCTISGKHTHEIKGPFQSQE